MQICQVDDIMNDIIKAPSENSAAYINRKGQHLVLLQAVCSALLTWYLQNVTARVAQDLAFSNPAGAGSLTPWHPQKQPLLQNWQNPLIACA